jgi:hypothetical protein
MSPGLDNPSWVMVGVCRARPSPRAGCEWPVEIGSALRTRCGAGERGGLVAWQPPQVRDEDLVPLTAGGLPRHLEGSHRDSAQTLGRIRPPATGRPSMAVPWTPKPTRTLRSSLPWRLAVLVGVAWALKSRDYAEEIPGTGATSLLFCQIERRLAGVSSPSSRSVSGTAVPMLSPGPAGLGVSGPGGVRGRPG